MKYKHLNQKEREIISQMKFAGYSLTKIAEHLRRAPSTISRELKRNRYPTNGRYIAYHAGPMYRGRRSRARRGSRYGQLQWLRVEALLREHFSPEQAAGWLKRHGEFKISYETIYRYVWLDRKLGGDLHTFLRGARKQRRKGYGKNDSRGRLAGKAMIEERPEEANNRSEIGHWEVDTVHGKNRASIATIVDRKSGYLLIGQLDARTVEATNKRLHHMISKHRDQFSTITSDNGCEFHGYRDLEDRLGVKFYFAHPYHSWERGTNENTNGLIRQYLPKGTCMEHLTQAKCNAIAAKLNNRPRKRLGFRTPAEIFHGKG